MAAAFLNRSHAVVWLPPRGAGERAFATEARLMVAQPGAKGAAAALPLQYQRCSLDALPKVRSVSLVFDARDVTLLAASLPTLPAARLLKAVPNVVEDSLLQDVGSCAFALGATLADGRRTVAVLDRSWLEFTVGAFERRGLNVAAAWPAQLVLPRKAGGWAICCMNEGLAVRTGDNQGFGWAASADPVVRHDAIVSAILSGRTAAAAEGNGKGELVIYAEDSSWREPIEKAAGKLGQAFRMAGCPLPRDCPVDLLEGRGGTAQQRWLARVDWRTWRWPAAIAAVCLLAWLLGLNLDWGRQVQERNALTVLMERKFRQTFPNSQLVDPMLQMQRQVSALRAKTGQSGPDDFVPLVARLARALGPRATDSLAGIEYRDGRLKLRFQPVFVESSAVREGLREACRQQGLLLRFDSDSEPTASVGLSS